MFYKIVNKALTFPPEFSSEACDCIRRLLTKSETERLGTGPRGGLEIMETSFFSSIDFDALMCKEIEPPYKPDLTELDKKYVPKTYLQAQAYDSHIENNEDETTYVFDAFPFQDSSILQK
jgi:hypothetical protein